jgi:hypothetical protein
MPLRIVVIGTMASNPYAGMAWMHMQITEGFRRLGHDVYYFEMTSTWPFDPVHNVKIDNSEYAVPYLAKVAESFGLNGRWALRRNFSDNEWCGLSSSQAEEILAGADIVFNISGATMPDKEGINSSRIVYYGTDPVIHEIQYANGDPHAIRLIAQHTDVVTYGENIGTPISPVPPLPRLRAVTRQPILINFWQAGMPKRRHFTTVGNWEQTELDLVFRGETYRWSKHHEFLRWPQLPKLIRRPLELATNLSIREPHRDFEAVPAYGAPSSVQDLLLNNGWQLANGPSLSLDPWLYRDYIQASSGEFTVARDLNVRLRSGWFSERSACYLAAGRPVITQDTGFGTVLPTGEGLFAFNTLEEILEAFDAIEANYERQSQAARDIAREYFSAEKVLCKLLGELGF